MKKHENTALFPVLLVSSKPYYQSQLLLLFEMNVVHYIMHSLGTSDNIF